MTKEGYIPGWGKLDMKRLFLASVLFGLAVFVCISTLACSEPEQPQSPDRGQGHPPPPHIIHESPSIDEMILVSDVIVVASFVSATAGVQSIPGDSGQATTYLPKQTLRFRATEYLKGTGPAEFTVEVVWDGGGAYADVEIHEGFTESEARTASAEAVAKRNTTWDNQPAVLFLADTDTSASRNGASGTSAGQDFGFIQSNYGAQSNFSYSVDTLSRTWLPAKEAPTDGAGGASGSTEFITDGAENPPPVTTLTALKTRVSEIADMLEDGEDVEGYEECVYHKLTRERHYRDHTPNLISKTLDSGLAAGSALRQSPKNYDDKYNVFSVSGTDADRFQTVIRDDDAVSSNGYYYDYLTVRPLAAGEYTANFHLRHYSYILCDFNPTETNYSTYTVTVTAPAGTLHEAFFDPVTIGTAVGADATNGVLKPVAFTLGGTSTQVTGLKWENNQMVLALDTFISLSGYGLDFIVLDGSVSLSLDVEDATVVAGVGTYSWSLETQPWEAGDLLMLRIREGS